MANSTILTALNATEFYDDDFASRTPIAIVLFLLIVATIFSNSMVFFAIYAFRGLRTVTNCFVISLSAADLSVALLAMPVWLAIGLLEPKGEKLRLLQFSTRWIEVFCSSVSIYGATLVSVDRYLAIIKPLRYKEMVTRQRAHKSIASVWFLSLVFAALTFIQFHNDTGVYFFAIFIFIAILCVPLCIMVFSYVCIYRAAVEQLSKMKCNHHNSASSSDKRRNFSSERRKRFYKELCITKTLAITVSLFVIAWAPFLVMTMVEIFSNPKIKMSKVLQGLILFLPYVNSFVNPWVYAGINKDFRKALKKLVCAPHEFCFCVRKDCTAKNRSRASSASTGRTLIGSFLDRDDMGSLKSSHTRGVPLQNARSQDLDLLCSTV